MQFLDNGWVTLFMTLWTIYALFGDDIRLLATKKGADPVFYVFTLIAMSFFTLEIVLCSIFKPGYVLGFYFWLDIISTITMIMDVGWVWDLIMPTSSSAGSQVKKIGQLVRASRSARLGSKASRLVRVVRLVRMLRIVKLYKHSNETLNKEEEDDDDEMLAQMMEEALNQKEESTVDVAVPEESKLGKTVTEATTKKVIIIVLSIILTVPVFSFDTYLTEVTSRRMGLDLITLYDDIRTSETYKKLYDDYVNYHTGLRNPLIFVAARDYSYTGKTDYNDLRDIEKELVPSDNESLSDYYIAVFDLRPNVRLEAIFGIIQTIMVCIVLVGGVFMLSKDANDIVIGPVEEMMTKVKRVAKNPLEAAREEENEALALYRARKEELIANRKRCCKKEEEEVTETKMLEQTIIKTASLLAIGLGEAGSEIIVKNVSNEGDSNINPLLPGNKVYAIFGFCDIRNFTDTTEILQEDVMIFVNEIAEIVHDITSLYLGAPNKNIGDAFLIVWKFFEKDIEVVDNELRLKMSTRINNLADLAAFAFIMVIAAVSRSKKIAKYRDYEELNQRMPNYRVKMGFGMHAGWAIEGAIGSVYKIDASYVSPHVNLTMALEEGTKIYGVPYVISHHFYDLLSKEVQQKMRPLDKIIISGFDEVTTLYTFDLDFNALKVKEEESKEMDRERHMFSRIKARRKRDLIKKGIDKGVYQIKKRFSTNSNIKRMRKEYTNVSYYLYIIGIFQYIQ